MSRVVPIELARLKGNPGRRPLGHGALQPTRTEAVPEPPDFLNEAAQAEWRRVAPELYALGLLTVLDLTIFAVYCVTFARWMQAERLLETEGLTAQGSRGNLVPHPLVKIATQAARDVCKLACEFGMTPAARARARAGWDLPPDGASKFGDLLA